MPTRGRHGWLARAVGGFLAQTGGVEAELLIVSEDGLPDVVRAQVDGRRIRHLECAPGLPLGRKRNLACAAARAELLLHWDDDDLQARDRLARQHHILARGATRVCGSSRVAFHEPATGRCWEYRYGGPRRPWVCGATLAYQRAAWLAHPFEPVDVGEDNAFVWAMRPDEVLDLDDPGLVLCRVHPGNSSPKRTEGPWWQPMALPAQWRPLVQA
jgi:glycosyltransferase involved in cell wall biosynthesis